MMTKPRLGTLPFVVGYGTSAAMSALTGAALIVGSGYLKGAESATGFSAITKLEHLDAMILLIAISLFVLCAPVAWIPFWLGLVACWRFGLSNLVSSLAAGLVTSFALLPYTVAVSPKFDLDDDYFVRLGELSLRFGWVSLAAGLVGGLAYHLASTWADRFSEVQA